MTISGISLSALQRADRENVTDIEEEQFEETVESEMTDAASDDEDVSDISEPATSVSAFKQLERDIEGGSDEMLKIIFRSVRASVNLCDALQRVPNKLDIIRDATFAAAMGYQKGAEYNGKFPLEAANAERDEERAGHYREWARERAVTAAARYAKRAQRDFVIDGNGDKKVKNNKIARQDVEDKVTKSDAGSKLRERFESVLGDEDTSWLLDYENSCHVDGPHTAAERKRASRLKARLRAGCHDLLTDRPPMKKPTSPRKPREPRESDIDIVFDGCE